MMIVVIIVNSIIRRAYVTIGSRISIISELYKYSQSIRSFQLHLRLEKLGRRKIGHLLIDPAVEISFDFLTYITFNPFSGYSHIRYLETKWTT